MRWIRGAILLGVGATLGVLGAPPAAADAPLATGWWWVGASSATSLAGGSLAKPPAPAGGFYLGATPTGSTAIGAIKYQLGPDTMATTLTLPVERLVGQAVVGVCPAAGAWTPAEGGIWDVRPTPDCSRSAPGTFSQDGTTLSFDVAGLVQDGVLDLVILPGLDASGIPSTFSLSLLAPTSQSLATAPRADDVAPTAPPSSVAPPRVVAPPAVGFFEPTQPFMPAPLPDIAPDIAEEPPAAEVARPRPQPLPLAPANAGGANNFGRIALWLTLGGLAIAATRARRAYTPNGTVVDVVLGVHPPAGLKSLPRFDQVWRVLVGVAAVGIVWAGAARQLPNGVPVGVVLFGATIGSLAGLVSLGLVLVYRANRIISFAQAAFGQVALIFTFELAFNWRWPYLVAATAGVFIAVGLSAAAEVGIMRRFRQAPRLIVTLATIGIANVLLFGMLITIVVFERNASVTAAGSVRYPSPLPDTAFVLSGITFSQDALLAMIVAPAVVIVLARFLSRSWWGMGIRAAAENGSRAETLAVPIGRLSTVTWMIAGGLAAVGTLLRAPVGGYSLQNLTGTGFLAIMLTAAVIGRFESMTWTFLGAIAIGVADQVFFYNFSRGAPLDGLHLAMILLAFLLFPTTTSRSRWQEATSWRAFREVRPIPSELVSVPIVRAASRYGRIALVGLVAAVPLVVSDISTLRLMSVMGTWAIAALSLVVLTGWAGHVSLGQWGIVGCGAFAAGKVISGFEGASPVVVLVASGLVGGVVAALIGIPAIRLRPMYLAVVTFAFATAASGWVFGWGSLQPTRDVARPSWLRSEEATYLLVLVVLVATVVATTNLRRSRFGRILVAARDNGPATESYGVNLFRARATAFVVSGVVAGLAGGLYVIVNQAVDVRDFTPERSLYLFTIAVIGGLGSIPGALIGAVYVVGAQYFLPEWGPFLATGVGMLLFLLIFPGGLGQIAYDGRDRILRWIARREGIVSPSLLADLRVPAPDLIEPPEEPNEPLGPPAVQTAVP